ncbi:Uncharacterised protein [uncultured archaeon]|nr:Uncharacterised protein [uncultured archaeon]
MKPVSTLLALLLTCSLLSASVSAAGASSSPFLFDLSSLFPPTTCAAVATPSTVTGTGTTTVSFTVTNAPSTVTTLSMRCPQAAAGSPDTILTLATSATSANIKTAFKVCSIAAIPAAATLAVTGSAGGATCATTVTVNPAATTTPVVTTPGTPSTPPTDSGSDTSTDNSAGSDPEAGTGSGTTSNDACVNACNTQYSASSPSSVGCGRTYQSTVTAALNAYHRDCPVRPDLVDIGKLVRGSAWKQDSNTVAATIFLRHIIVGDLLNRVSTCANARAAYDAAVINAKTARSTCLQTNAPSARRAALKSCLNPCDGLPAGSVAADSRQVSGPSGACKADVNVQHTIESDCRDAYKPAFGDAQAVRDACGTYADGYAGCPVHFTQDQCLSLAPDICKSYKALGYDGADPCVARTTSSCVKLPTA